MFTYMTIKENGRCHYMRRVPNQFSQFDNRRFVKKSLKTRDPQEGLKRALIYNEIVEAEWNKGLGLSPNADTSYELAIRNAEFHGFNYKTASEISESDIERIVTRLLAATKPKECPQAVAALLGGQNHPSRSLDDLWAEFYEFNKLKLKGKSASQTKRWINPRIRAYKTFVKVCGDIAVENITREHVMEFRNWWLTRLEGDMSPNSANKDFTHLKSMLSFAQDNWKGIPFDVTSMFARLRFEEEDSHRKPFETEYIKSILLDHERLRGLNDECRYFLFAMADTGARPSELLGLDASRGDIRLDTDIPYIFIRPDENRQIKNKHSERKIPLVGASLYAFQQIPQGFTRYYQSPDRLSANLNKFLRARRLLPSENHSVYSLRHSFEDRLSEVNPPEKVHSFLMGHSYRRERYGNGISLEQKKEWLDKICFKGFEAP